MGRTEIDHRSLYMQSRVRYENFVNRGLNSLRSGRILPDPHICNAKSNEMFSATSNDHPGLVGETVFEHQAVKAPIKRIEGSLDDSSIAAVLSSWRRGLCDCFARVAWTMKTNTILIESVCHPASATQPAPETAWKSLEFAKRQSCMTAKMKT